MQRMCTVLSLCWRACFLFVLPPRLIDSRTHFAAKLWTGNRFINSAHVSHQIPCWGRKSICCPQPRERLREKSFRSHTLHTHIHMYTHMDAMTVRQHMVAQFRFGMLFLSSFLVRLRRCICAAWRAHIVSLSRCVCVCGQTMMGVAYICFKLALPAWHNETKHTHTHSQPEKPNPIC